jgi:hypothetical protein
MKYHFMLAAIFCCSDAMAVEVYSNYDERFERSTRIASEDVESAFGARVSPATGALSFSVPVLSIPISNELSIDVTYKLGIRSIAQSTEWYFEEDRPYLTGTFSVSAGWTTKIGGDARCSNAKEDPPLVPSSNGRRGNFYPKEYWYGYFLSLPSGGGRINALYSSPTPAAPTTGENYYWATNDYWYFSCSPLTVGAGEGFVGHAPDGTKYYFDTMSWIPLPDLNKNHVTGYELELERQEIRLYAGKIEDRFGNYVTGLTASDGTAVVKTVAGATVTYTFGGRQWVVKTTNPFTITYPDGSTWSANVSGNLFTSTSLKDHCPGNPNYSLPPNTAVASVKSPAGATGVFTVKQVLIGYSYVSGGCVDSVDGGGTDRPSRLVVPALVSRSISGPGLTATSLSIDYGPLNDCFSNSLYWDPKCTSSSPTTRVVTYSYSDARYRRYTFGNRQHVDADMLLKLEEGSSGSAPSRTTDYQYAWLDEVGAVIGEYPYGPGEVKRAVLTSKKVVQDGRAFSWTVPSNCSGAISLCIDQYGRPTKVVKDSAPSP